MEQRCPTNLLTGFLGSGKTTLLNAWLRSPALADTAVIVNEFGEIGIDHALIASSNDNTIELSTGCLCCTVRGDLVETLRDLNEKRARGEVRQFSRVFIETTGLADPAPVVQALMTFPVARKFALNQIIATVDAYNGMATLDRHKEAVKQIAVADDIIVTKTDLGGGSVAELTARIRKLNPGARLHYARPDDQPGIDTLARQAMFDITSKPAEVAGWLNAEAHEEHHHHGHGHHHHHDVNRHDAAIGSFCLSFDAPLAWEHVANWLDALVIAHGDDLLRVKGILDIEGRRNPIVVQAVQRLFHPPFELQAWPEGPRRSQIVFITRNLSRDFVAEVLATIRSRPIAPAPKF
jgi:G3E family GTPase